MQRSTKLSRMELSTEASAGSASHVWRRPLAHDGLQVKALGA